MWFPIRSCSPFPSVHNVGNGWATKMNFISSYPTEINGLARLEQLSFACYST